MQITRTSTCRTHIAGPKPWRFGSRTSEGRYRLEHESVRVRLDSLASCDTSRPSVLPVRVFVTRTRLAWEFFVVSGLTAADLASPEILRRAGTSKECSPVQSNLALWIFVHANTLKPLRLNFVGSFGCQIERVSDPVD
uniref:Uncharacterized protein n=1 Tax=Cacopsylla melanoneura TaxID=428564 RepID=A0A8D8LZ79_9HEMI